jgi:hypothetical protein
VQFATVANETNRLECPECGLVNVNEGKSPLFRRTSVISTLAIASVVCSFCGSLVYEKFVKEYLPEQKEIIYTYRYIGPNSAFIEQVPFQCLEVTVEVVLPGSSSGSVRRGVCNYAIRFYTTKNMQGELWDMRVGNFDIASRDLPDVAGELSPILDRLSVESVVRDWHKFDLFDEMLQQIVYTTAGVTPVSKVPEVIGVTVGPEGMFSDVSVEYNQRIYKHPGYLALLLVVYFTFLALLLWQLAGFMARCVDFDSQSRYRNGSIETGPDGPR